MEEYFNVIAKCLLLNLGFLFLFYKQKNTVRPYSVVSNIRLEIFPEGAVADALAWGDAALPFKLSEAL